MSDQELLPCPFCGGDAKLGSAEEAGENAYVISCIGCLASSPVRFAIKEPVDQLLREAWNKRASGQSEVLELAARILDKRVQIIVNESGSREWDTNVVNLPEWAETVCEELEELADEIRALKSAGAS